MGLFLGPILLAVAYNLLSDWIASTPRTPPGEGRGPDA
ncbi:AI-2E family transporter, partial [Pseudomonas aeruginosa]|nr:AI-2E family transporter [Pseudomonas aeruginosa]